MRKVYNINMKNQTKKAKKAQKARERRKDFVKKKNIIANCQTIKKIYKKPVYKQEKNRKGVVKVVQIGEKEVVYSVRKSGPRVKFPKSRKFKK
jgi:hypothetical protein